MDLTLHQLHLLREVAAHGTISAAAEANGYTPSAVSQQLAGLERACGAPVLERFGRNVRLTDAGNELVRRGGDILAGAEAALAAVAQLEHTPQGPVAVAVYESVAATLLPPLLARLARTHPDIAVRSVQRDPDRAIEELARGDLDLAFTIDYAHSPAEKRPDITRWTVGNDRFHLVVAADDPLARRATVDLDEVAERPFVASPPELSCGRCVIAACRSAGFEPQIAHALDDYPTTMRLVAAGAGVALIPDLGLVETPPGVVAVELRQPFSRVVELAVRTASASRPTLIAVRDALAEVTAALDLHHMAA